MARSTGLIVPELTQFVGVREFKEKTDVFNAAVGGCIELGYDTGFLNANGGDYLQPVAFARPSGLVSHVDEADPATSDTAVAITQAKGASVFQTNRALAYYTRDEVTRGKATPAQWSQAVGQFIAEEKLKKLRDNLLASAVAAVQSMDTPSANYHIYDVSRGKAAGAKVTATYAYLNRVLSKMGDAREDIKLLVMHSNVFADLVGDGISNIKIDSVAGQTIASDVPGLFGRQILVVDSTSLYSALTSSYYTEYYVLGLAAGALKARIIGEDPISEDPTITTKVMRWTIRQDFDTEYTVQGMKWIVGTVNPTDAELATAGSWDENLSDHRECGVVMGTFNAT